MTKPKPTVRTLARAAAVGNPVGGEDHSAKSSRTFASQSFVSLPFQGIGFSLTNIVLACFTKMSLRPPDGFSCFWRVYARFQGF